MGLTIGAYGGRRAGFLHLGNGSLGAAAQGLLHMAELRGHHGYHHTYPNGHYYRHYSPIYSYPDDCYRPLYGYTYATVYYNAPFAYRFYDRDTYYVDRVVEEREVYDAQSATSGAPPLQGPPAPDATYQVLTEPGDATLVGQGNAAFAAGRYDEARRFYVSAMLADERDGYAKFLYALANFAMREYDVAGLAIRRALLTTPTLIDFPVDMRSLYEHASAFETQLESLAGFVRNHPEDHGPMLLLGYMHYAAGAPGPALPILERLTNADSDDTIASLLRDAVLRAKRGEKPRE